MKQAESTALVQPPRQQDRERNLVELQPGPISSPVDPTVLRKTAVRPLDRRQPDQRAQRRACLIRGEERHRAMHEVARPNEMITTQVLVPLCLAPGNAHRRDHCALKNFVLMREQHASAQPIHSAVVASICTKIKFPIHHCALPLTNVRGLM